MNFIWNTDLDWDLGEERSPGEFWMKENGKEIVHSCFRENEADQFFKGVDLLHKQKRHVTRRRRDKLLNSAYLDYIVRKL